MAASGMRDVDFALLAGETQRIPSLALPAVFAAPSVADDLARDVVTELFRDLAELFDRADIGFLVELTQRRRPRVLAAIDAALRQLPGVSVIDMLGPVEAAADEDTAFAVEDRHGNAGAIRQRFERRHLFRSGVFTFAHDARSPLESRALRPEKATGRPQATPCSVSNLCRASSARRSSGSAGKPSFSGCRE